ncbi:bifunctional riboflavin kinase/FAD synthetase [Membranihabitans maritimus]|uniref:bifunctional riboflavin kinase/FAD synthetase n=1 Tax=Membranihabitans maritimus TaxID=2904244 RepID=UPI001F027891|nr:bifunctional riboflavin kinase/FAD synthetase [Membranihabitans maritimus]
MNVYRSLEELPQTIKNPVITFGSFDGVHLGHSYVFNRMKAIANEVEGETIVTTFHPHPRKVIYPSDKSLSLITTIEEKINLFEKNNIDHLVIMPFSVEFSQITPQEYIETFIIKSFRPHTIVIGYDHRFGLNRKGDINTLRWYEKNNQFKVVEIPQKRVETMKISSTVIRKSIQNGDVVKANTLLGHNFKLSGTVIHGEKLGEKIGYKTANISPVSKEKLIPGEGIYAVFVNYDEYQYKGMLYIGTKPTIRSNGQKSIEVHIFDFNEIVYGKEIEVEFIEFIRKDATFGSLEELREKINSDREQSLKILNGIRRNYKIEI